jgi:UDP-N-acetylglucosamine:LPS N-acetylglucosamine transferase
VGGGDGIGNLVEITVALAKQLGEDTATESQVVVICGKNEQIKDTLLAKQ